MKLTPAGRAYALAHARTSIVARVALVGHDNGWPEEHISAAIRACNDAGERKAA